ncbi:MAG TPA: ATP-binding protein [Verrucomicrobiae bacterium]|jgi:heavy metal sensor kinase
MNHRSLRFRLILWYVGLLTAVFLLFGAALYLVLRNYLETSFAETLNRRSEQIAVSLLANIDKTGDAYVADQIATRYAPENYDRFIRITRPDGTVLYASGKTADFRPEEIPQLDPKKIPNHFTRKIESGGGPRLMDTVKIFEKKNGQKYLIESAGPLAPIETILSRLVVSLLIGLPLLGIVGVCGALFLVGRALAPVVETAQSAERITLHNLNERLPLTKTGDELEQLSLALNRMIARLSDSFEQNRRFLADASHELRTPLAALRGELESVVAESSKVPELSDRVGSALEEVDRLAKIVDALFAISRLDAGEARQERTQFDLAPLAASTTEQMSLLAEDKGITVECDAKDTVTVEGDRARIKQIVVNLLDNAIKYTPRGGSISLNVRAAEEKAIIEVADTGIGIPATALPHIFERFFRVDEARSRDAGGAGLGLAIVKSICAAHGGSVRVESAPSQGSRFKVELPLAKSARNYE